MARTGRPIHLRTEKTLGRDIAALRRLEKSLAVDGRFGPALSNRAAQAIRLTIAILQELRLSI